MEAGQASSGGRGRSGGRSRGGRGRGRGGRGRGRGGGGRNNSRGGGGGGSANVPPNESSAADNCENDDNPNWAIDGYHLNQPENRHHNNNTSGSQHVSDSTGGDRRGGENNKSRDRNRNNNNSKNNANHKNKQGGDQDGPTSVAHWALEECLERYNAKDPTIIRGTLRVMPGRDAKAFCTCDRGMHKKDVLIETPKLQNRAMDGDTVYVQLLEDDDATSTTNQDHGQPTHAEAEDQNEPNSLASPVAPPQLVDHARLSCNDPHGNQAAMNSVEGGDRAVELPMWQDDPIQMSLWAPVVPIRRHEGIARPGDMDAVSQRKGRVVHVVPPKLWQSEIHPTQQAPDPCRSIIGTLKQLQRGITLITPNNRALPQFMCSSVDVAAIQKNGGIEEGIFQAKYVYGSWKEGQNWPPCVELKQMGTSCNVEDETKALLIANNVDHGEFPVSVLEECQNVVASGEYQMGNESGWKPTPEMYQGRRDYRHRRIFTIDPTTAKDLDDALHIELLDNGQVEIGVHIADVSYFIQPDSCIDLEAQRRCTTVYLVDRTVPMLPRPLCEIACSLNENVERLAFSCVWRMNLDGTLVEGGKAWYGRTVIKSCARLDYATAQNIIEDKVATGESNPDDELWPKSRQPTGGHTIAEVAGDVRLMNKIAQARRRLRFQHGAIALSKVKLTFQLDGDRETPLLCEPYAIRDSNRLVEEYMLLANYLVAERIITHAGERALLRHHEPPPMDGLEKVAAVAKAAIGFTIDITSSQALQKSLNRLARECSDELAIQCVTEMLKTPLKPANYIAAGEIPEDGWAHFALNIPYYTHFTSPIRRYADVMVHRLLQATIDGEEYVENFPYETRDIGVICGKCNTKKDASRKAQDRSDEVFLALYLRRHPIRSKLGIVLSVGEKAFTVFVPSLGVSAKLFLEEHQDWVKASPFTLKEDRRIKLERTSRHNGEVWSEIVIKFFTKLRVTCVCNDKPPISVKIVLEGPWIDNAPSQR